MQLPLFILLVIPLCASIVRLQSLGLGGMERPKEMNQRNQMEQGFGVNVALGLNANSYYSRSNRMGNEGMKRRRRAAYEDKPKSCFVILQVPVAGTTTTAASVDPRANDTQT